MLSLSQFCGLRRILAQNAYAASGRCAGREVTDMEHGEKPLSFLKPGQAALVTQVLLTGNTCRRLQDLGVIPGTRIRCDFFAPSGSPGAYSVLGKIIALRRQDAGKVMVRPWD